MQGDDEMMDEDDFAEQANIGGAGSHHRGLPSFGYYKHIDDVLDNAVLEWYIILSFEWAFILTLID